MNASPHVVAMIVLTFGGIHGDSVTQMPGQTTVSEGVFLTVNCTYTAKATNYPSLFWYVQYPGKTPQLLFRVSKAKDKGGNKGFEATYDKETSSFHLEKFSVQESDSAVYYCALSDTVVGTAGGAEHQL
ncbi:T-cell receptor alpha chain V region CTL-F3 [Heterocephalus glaber]|nr:T-cell receptor alpha chain V region CTL-F3 [Heterocephalus glaber]